jgi:hypothetical protein
MADETKILLDESEMPQRWYNIVPDLPEPPPPPLHPGTKEPVTPDFLGVLFPMNLIMRTIPSGSPTPTDERMLQDEVVRGKYLLTVAACGECHTPQDKGKQVAGKFLAGGMEFKFPNGAVVRSANITPDKQTGIGNWTEDAFVQRFKSYEGPEASAVKVAPEDFNTVMPWAMYAGMTEEDLRAIYKYLSSLEPYQNRVERFTPATAVAKK